MHGRVAALIVALLAGASPALGQPNTVLILGSPSSALELELQHGLRARRLQTIPLPALGSAEPGGADPDESVARDAEQAISRARQLYLDVQPARAVTILDAQLRDAGPTLVQARRLDLLATLQLWRAVCLLKRSDREGARAAAASAILLGQALPDETRFGPAVAETFASVRRELGRLQTAQLALSVIPPTAQVSLDGKSLGASASLPPGEHWLMAEAPGYLSTARTLRLRPGEKVSLKLTLYPADRSLLRRQLRRLASRGELDPQTPAVALALCRWSEAAQGLLVRESQGELTLARLACDRGEVMGRFQARASGPVDALVQRALAQLWGSTETRTATAVPRRTPFYKSWWFWTLVGAAVVGGATAGAVVGTRGPGTYTLRP